MGLEETNITMFSNYTFTDLVVDQEYSFQVWSSSWVHPGPGASKIFSHTFRNQNVTLGFLEGFIIENNVIFVRPVRKSSLIFHLGVIFAFFTNLPFSQKKKPNVNL